MDKRLKSRWVKALRSGKFNQGRDRLRYKRHDKVYHCCLGVLCEIQDGEWHKRKFKNGSISHPLITKLLPHNTRNILAGMNDGFKSFSEIADYIEKNV